MKFQSPFSRKISTQDICFMKKQKQYTRGVPKELLILTGNIQNVSNPKIISLFHALKIISMTRNALSQSMNSLPECVTGR